MEQFGYREHHLREVRVTNLIWMVITCAHQQRELTVRLWLHSAVSYSPNSHSSLMLQPSNSESVSGGPSRAVGRWWLVTSVVVHCFQQVFYVSSLMDRASACEDPDRAEQRCAQGVFAHIQCTLRPDCLSQ